jgi:glycosyltransferase involved in cell wall biosynthesis/SAM-dependent methyltransferase
MKVLLAFGGIDKRGGITPDLRLLERGLAQRGIEVAVAGSLREVQRHLQRGDGDVVHVFGCLPSITIFGGIGCGRAHRRPVVWTPVFHPGRLTYWIGSGRHRPMQLFDRVATRTARHVDAVVAATGEEAQFFARLGSPLVDVNPPVVEATGSRLTGAARRRARATFGLGDEPLVLMIAAHSARRKGMAFARDAFVELQRRVPDARLLVIGGGSTEGLEALSGTVVGGWCSDEDLLGAYGSADVLFVPSRYEQFSRVTLEAWAHELPVVVSDGVALATLARDHAGMVVPFGDARAAAAALASILSTPAMARRFGTAGRAMAEDHFSLERHVDRMLELYDVLLAAAPSPPARRSQRSGPCPQDAGWLGAPRDPTPLATRGHASSLHDVDRGPQAAAYFAATGTVVNWWDPLGDADPDQRRWLAAQLDGLLAVCPVEGRRVLDAATGRGRAAIACAARGAAAVVALDISEDMLAAAKDDAARAGVADRIEFRHADVSDPVQSLRDFDVAFLLEALLHLDDPVAVLRHLHDALVPGGSLVVTTNGTNPIARLVQPPRRSGRAANRLQIATVSLANQLLTPLFGFQWSRSRTMGALYRSVFNVPVRPLGATTVRRMLLAAGFTELDHLVARHRLLVREHRWIARRAVTESRRDGGARC